MLKIVSHKYPELLVRLGLGVIQFESGEASINDPKIEKEFLDFVKRSDSLELEIVENSADEKPAEESKESKESKDESDPENLV